MKNFEIALVAAFAALAVGRVASSQPVQTDTEAAKPLLPRGAQWLRMPNADDFARAYPERAQRLQVSGQAKLTCVVNEEGGFKDCTFSDEQPSDYGFGAAVLKVAPLFRMAPMTKTGESAVGRSVTIPVNFKLAR